MPSPSERPEPLLTPAEIASMFRVDPKTVTRWAKAGKLTPAFRTLGGHRRYRESDVNALLARELEQFRIKYWAPGESGRIPAVYRTYEGRPAAESALRAVVRGGYDRPWIERWDTDRQRWERVNDA